MRLRDRAALFLVSCLFHIVSGFAEFHNTAQATRVFEYNFYSYPRPLVGLEVVNGGLQGSSGLVSGGLSSLFRALCLKSQFRYSIANTLIYRPSTLREVSRSLSVLLSCNCTNTSSGNQLLGLLRSGIIVAIRNDQLHKSEESNRQSKEKFNVAIRLFPNKLLPIALIGMVWIMAFGCWCVAGLGCLFLIGMQGRTPLDHLLVGFGVAFAGYSAVYLIHVGLRMGAL